MELEREREKMREAEGPVMGCELPGETPPDCQREKTVKGRSRRFSAAEGRARRRIAGVGGAMRGSRRCRGS